MKGSNALQEAKEIHDLIKSKDIYPNKSYTVDTLAEKLGLNPETIRVYIRDMKKDGMEVPLKVGKSYTFSGLWVAKLFSWLYEKQLLQ